MVKAPHFFRVILNDSLEDGKLRIPRKFMMKYGKGLSNEAVLKVPSGAEWKVELTKLDDDVWLQKGWREFMEYYSIKEWYFLLFRYDGNSHFYVVIINGNATEIDYPFNDSHGDQEDMLDEEFECPEVEETESESDSDSSVEIFYELSSSCPKTREKTHPSNKIGSTSKCTQPKKKKPKCEGVETYAHNLTKSLSIWEIFVNLGIGDSPPGSTLVNHGNLVKLEGFCIDPEDATCYLIYEFVENGSLHSWLHENKNEKLNWKTRLRIAIDVANGLQYIHEHTRPRVVHKDIKSSNILLDMNIRAKIANFGLAKSGCNAITMHIVGTQGYIAPEYLADGVVSTKMDVFSFGVVLLELISGKEAIDEEGNVLWAKASGILEGNEERKVKRVKEWMDEVLVGETCPIDSVMNVMTVAIACLHRDPSRRPSMVDVVYALCKSDDFGFDISDDGISAPLVVAR